MLGVIYLRHWIPFIVYFAILLVILVRSHVWGKAPRFGQRITIISLLIYLVAILWLCLTPATFQIESAPKILFYFHGIPFNVIPLQGFSPEFFLNIVMTLPFGVFIYLINPQTPFERASLAGFLLSAFIECNQFIGDFLFQIGRFADIDDLITNTLGTMIGFAIMIILDQTSFHKLLQYFMLKLG